MSFTLNSKSVPAFHEKQSYRGPACIESIVAREFDSVYTASAFRVKLFRLSCGSRFACNKLYNPPMFHVKR